MSKTRRDALAPSSKVPPATTSITFSFHLDTSNFSALSPAKSPCGMAATVLGKRTRSSTVASGASI